MKKVSLIIGLVLAVSILFAQEERHAPKEKGKVRIEKYKERLNLTDTQIAELKEMRASLKPELEALRNDDTKPRSEKMRERADIMEKQEKEIARILNSEQEAELIEIKKEARANAMERRELRKEKRQGEG